MSLGVRVIAAIERRRLRKRKQLPGPLGEFYRNSGEKLLYELPITTSDLVVDAGGFAGEWTSKMLIRYGCRSEIFEPIPAYSESLQRLFRENAMVQVHAAALGGSARTTSFSIASDSSSEFLSNGVSDSIEVEVKDIFSFIESLNEEYIACLKLNIEGGEYEVLERLIDMNQTSRFKSFLIQFHKQPEGWEERYNKITLRLRETHNLEWCYPMVWEKWVRRENINEIAV